MQCQRINSHTALQIHTTLMEMRLIRCCVFEGSNFHLICIPQLALISFDLITLFLNSNQDHIAMSFQAYDDIYQI